MATEFEKLASEPFGIRRGRKVRTEAEREARKAETKAKMRLRNEARRRAHMVLQYRYEDEFKTLMQEELNNLSKNQNATNN